MSLWWCNCAKHLNLQDSSGVIRYKDKTLGYVILKWAQYVELANIHKNIIEHWLLHNLENEVIKQIGLLSEAFRFLITFNLMFHVGIP